MRGRKPAGRNGLTQQKAVEKAIECVGDQTQLSVLALEAARFYGRTIDDKVVGMYRSKWRRKNRINRDNRTYTGQPRRNMLNDKVVDLPQIRRINAFMRTCRSLNPLNALLASGTGEFHSIEQLRLAIAELAELRRAA